MVAVSVVHRPGLARKGRPPCRPTPVVVGTPAAGAVRLACEDPPLAAGAPGSGRRRRSDCRDGDALWNQPETRQADAWTLVMLGDGVRGRRELQADTPRARRGGPRTGRRRRSGGSSRNGCGSRGRSTTSSRTMAAVKVQMGVALAAFDERPDMVRAALLRARTSSRGPCRSCGSPLALLREAAPTGSDDPAPGLGQLGDLVAGPGSPGGCRCAPTWTDVRFPRWCSWPRTGLCRRH
jgi:hypothetical protein